MLHRRGSLAHESISRPRSWPRGRQTGGVNPDAASDETRDQPADVTPDVTADETSDEPATQSADQPLDDPVLPRMYTDLAHWWPLLSPPEDYVDEASMITGLVRSALAGAGPAGWTDGRRPALLELGSGGGHNAVHLADEFEPVLVDASAQMVATSRRLNPDLEHHVGDMRTVRLGRRFDAVLVHDAIDYMVTEKDLDAVFATVRAHLDVGGVAVLVPDHLREHFTGDTDHGGTDAEDGSGIRYLEWSWDPDPEDSWAQTEFSYVIRAADGTVSTAAESHRFGLFGLQTWLDGLDRHGFDVTTVDEQDEDDAWMRTIFVGVVVE